MEEQQQEKNGDSVRNYVEQIGKKMEGFNEEKKEEIKEAIDKIFKQAYEEEVKKRKSQEEL